MIYVYDIKDKSISINPENPILHTIKAPYEPTAREVEDHKAAGHCQFRAWCPTCVAAAAPEGAHIRHESPPHEFPIFSSDCAFMNL